MASQNNALAVVAPVAAYAIMQFSPAEVMAIIEENLGADRLKASDLDRLTVPTGGGKLWEVQTLEGEQNVPTISGVVLLWKQVRAYWQADFNGGKNPPDCSSEDCITGVTNPESTVELGGSCESCPMAQWKSKKGGRGQACKQQRLLYLLRPESMLPVAVGVPPTSLGALKKYFLRLASAGIRPSAVVTTLALERVSGGGTVPDYSVIVPTMESRLDPEQQAIFKSLGDALKPMLESVTLEALGTGGFGDESVSAV